MIDYNGSVFRLVVSTRFILHLGIDKCRLQKQLCNI